MPECIQMLLQKGCIDDISIMREGEMAGLAGDFEGLDVLHSAHVGGGIAHVAYAVLSFQAVQIRFRENVFDQTCSFMQMDKPLFIYRSDATALLPTVLEALQAQKGQAGGLSCSVDSEDAAFFVDFFHGLIC